MADETAFYDVVDRINALALDDSDWPETLTLIADLFGAVGGSFELLETSTKRPIFFQYGSELGDAPTQSYLAYYGNISPRVKFGIRQPTGAISYDHMILSESEIDRDEFYMDCIAPQGLRYFVGAKLLCSPSHDAVFAIQRSPQQGHVGGADIATMERLLPYLQNAMDLKFRVAAAQTKAAVGLDGLEQLQEACLILDTTGAVLHANAAAAELLSNGDGVDVTNGRLTFADRAASRRYEASLDRSLPPDSEPVPDFPAQRPSGRRPYIVSLRRVPAQNAFSSAVWPAAALLFIRDPDRFTRLDTALLSQSYGLTAAEAETAAALDRGLTLREIAAERRVAVSTIRTHLYALMAKTKLRRQTDLVRLLTQYHLPFR